MELISKNTRKILKNKKKIESVLKVKINIRRNKVEAEGEPLDIFIADKVIEAIDAGFPVKIALTLADPEFLLEKLAIKNLTNRKKLSEVRARIIGKNGQTLDLLEDLSDCFVKLHENIVYIIGKAEDIKRAINAATKIIQGSKQSSVYAYLEKQSTIMHDDDLGLKIE